MKRIAAVLAAAAALSGIAPMAALGSTSNASSGNACLAFPLPIPLC